MLHAHLDSLHDQVGPGLTGELTELLLVLRTEPRTDHAPHITHPLLVVLIVQEYLWHHTPEQPTLTPEAHAQVRDSTMYIQCRLPKEGDDSVAGGVLLVDFLRCCGTGWEV